MRQQQARPAISHDRWQRTITSWVDDHGVFQEEVGAWSLVEPDSPARLHLPAWANRVAWVFLLIATAYIIAVVLATAWC